MRRRRKLVTLGASVAAALVVVSVGSAGSAQHSTSTDLLRVASTAQVTTWDPVKSFSTEVLVHGQPLRAARLREPSRAHRPRSGPGLAKSWSKSADGKTWTFHLRRGVTFHDGEPLTADAVKQSIEAAADHGGASFIWAALSSVTAPDSSTVVIKMKSPTRVDLIASSEDGAWIVCPAALKAVAADPNYFESGKDCGTGPYMLKSYTRRQGGRPQPLQQLLGRLDG